jgi:hypothetical protein
MSIPRISGHDYSRAGDLVQLFREYSDLADSSSAASLPLPSPQDNALLQAAPVKAIDNPQRGTRSFVSRIAAPAENRIRSKRDPDNAGDVVQGSIRRWERMAAQDYQALEAIPGADESEGLLRTDKPYMRRLSDVAAQRDKSRSAPASQTPVSKKVKANWSFGMNQALRARAQFARMHGVLFDASSTKLPAFDLP